MVIHEHRRLRNLDRVMLTEHPLDLRVPGTITILEQRHPVVFNLFFFPVPQPEFLIGALMFSNKVKKMSARVFLPTAALGVAVTFYSGGAVVAGIIAPKDRPANISSDPKGNATAAEKRQYPINAAGKSYGSADADVDPANWPDLILVEATGGSHGYVDRKRLDEVTGSEVRTPEEAVAWQKAMDAAQWDEVELPVYDSEGKIRVGTFKVSRSRPTQ